MHNRKIDTLINTLIIDTYYISASSAVSCRLLFLLIKMRIWTCHYSKPEAATWKCSIKTGILIIPVQLIFFSVTFFKLSLFFICIYIFFFFNKFFFFFFFFLQQHENIIKSNNKKNSYINQLLRLPLLKYTHTEKKQIC